jgi:hypothetical protein
VLVGNDAAEKALDLRWREGGLVRRRQRGLLLRRKERYESDGNRNDANASKLEQALHGK